MGTFGSIEGFKISDQFLFTLLLFVLQVFLIGISAWLWLRKTPIPQGLEVAQEVLSKALIAQGYQVLSLRDLINQPERQDEIDEEFVASVDLIANGIIQALDGNLLAPLLFSEAVNLHPVAIIVAILFFGGLWGFWGIFFAIPLATVINAVVRAWPRSNDTQEITASGAE